MKKSRKLMSILLVVAMLFTLAAPAMAAPTDTTISVAADDDRTYDVYQIFTGDVAKDENKNEILSNVKWGKNGTGTKGEAVEQAVLEALKNAGGSDTQKLAVIKDYVKLESDAFTTVSNTASVTVPTGYYLFVDKGVFKDGQYVVPDGQELGLYVVQVVDKTVISPKRDDVTSFKKVDDKNDSNTSEDAVVWQDSADYDIGDTIDFQLTGTVTKKYDQYTKYEYIFHDEESTGLTFDKGSVKVYVDGTQITSGFTIVEKPSCKHENCTFEIRFDNLKDIDAVHAESVITVEYQSTLNESANIGSKGNPNIMYLEYSNNPNVGGTGKTPEDKVIVFTYQTVINKIDPEENPLTGAEFELGKKLADGTWKSIAAVKNDEGTTFTFKGLDDGLYRLKETKTPDGYNTIDDIYFEITAAHDADSPNPTLTDLGVIEKVKNIAGDLEDGEVAAFAATCTKGTGTIESDVVNNSGATLPETGGMGTTIFYVVGGALVLGAAVLLVTRRRMAE